MAVVDYDGMTLEVAEVLVDAGREVTLLKGGETAVDPAVPWDAAGATGGVSLTVTAVMDKYSLRDIDGETVRAGDQMALVAGSSVPANQDMRTFDGLLDGGERWRVVDVRPIKPGPVTVLYILQLRRG